jgi:hypothetical protein
VQRCGCRLRYAVVAQLDRDAEHHPEHADAERDANDYGP